MELTMIYFELILAFLFISSTFPVNYALKMEKLIGGYASSHSEFKYQAALIGKYNFSNATYLFGSAGIISDYLLITAARCFIHKLIEIKRLSFFVVVDADLLIANNIVLRNILEIYTYNYNGFSNDLAVIKLRESLDIQNQPHLSALDIPHEDENFEGEVGVVAGYGIQTTDKLINHGKRERIRIASRYGLQLNCADVFVITDGQTEQFINSNGSVGPSCGNNVLINHLTEICGVMLPDAAYVDRGVCMGDNGAPLVNGNKVIGVVSKHNIDCDDTTHGTIYTKVANFYAFIDGLKRNRPLAATKTYRNPWHIPHPKYLVEEMSVD